MESRVKTYRSILAAVAFAALATTASLARHGGGKSAPASGKGAAHHENFETAGTSETAAASAGKTAPNYTTEGEKNAGRPAARVEVSGGAAKKSVGEVGIDAGRKASSAVEKTGAGVHGIDLVRPDDGYASLRRRATRSLLIATGKKKSPTIVPPPNLVARPPILHPSALAALPRNAIGVAATTNTGTQNLGVAQPSSSVAVNGNVAKTSIGSNASETRHESLHPAPIVSTSNHSTGLNGTQMGRPNTSPATLGGPAHSVSGIGGASIRPTR